MRRSHNFLRQSSRHALSSFANGIPESNFGFRYCRFHFHWYAVKVVFMLNFVLLMMTSCSLKQWRWLRWNLLLWLDGIFFIPYTFWRYFWCPAGDSGTTVSKWFAAVNASVVVDIQNLSYFVLGLSVSWCPSIVVSPHYRSIDVVQNTTLLQLWVSILILFSSSVPLLR